MLTCTLCSSLKKIFPDEVPPQEGFTGLSLLRREYGAFQVALQSDRCAVYDIAVESDLNVRTFAVCNFPVQKACNDNADDYYLRKTPGLYPDLLRPTDSISVGEGTCAVWFEIGAGEYADGVHTVHVRFSENGQTAAECTVSVEIIPAALPEQSLICTHWFHTDCISTYYNVPVFSEEYWRITENFVCAAVEHGVNFLLTPLFTPPLDTAVGKERPTVQLVDVTLQDGKYSFGFDKLHRWFQMCLRCGVQYFEMSHLFTQWGAMHAPKIMATVDGKYKQLFGWKTWAASKKYTAFLRTLAPELDAFLRAEGVADRCRFHVSDEPSMERIKEYGKRSALIRELFPDYPVTDALSDFDFYERGLLKEPIPCIDRAAKFAGHVPALWTYYCCCPGNEYFPNRFMAMPSQRNRVLGYQMYKYEVKGFLQWGLNFWYSQLSDHPIDPFTSSDPKGSFPEGDAYVLYPGENGEPLVSLRFKVFRDALQDQRALNLLESLIGRKKTLELLESDGVLTFNEYPHSDAWQLQKREQINRAIKENLQ